MLLTDVYFFFSILGLSILVTIAAFYWKQLWWIGLFGGFLWIMLGLWGINGADNPVITSQREISIVFIVVGIGVFFMPMYLNRKENKSASEEFDEYDEWNRETTSYQDQLNKLRRATGRRPKEEE